MGRSWVCGLVAFIILVALGCGGTKDRNVTAVLSQPEALKLAVSLANEDCLSKFSMAPFDSTSSTIEFKDGRWSWGGLDLAGHAGLSASVSFDAHGNDRRVEVYLSTDRLQGSNR